MTKALVPVLLIAAGGAVLAQTVSTADYARAERFMTYNTTPLVRHRVTRVTWVAENGAERVWYRTRTDNGNETVIVDPIAATKSPCDLPARREAARQPEDPGTPPVRPIESRSPDGKSAAFIREWNLWLRDIASGRETQLTKDGVKDYGYATDNAGWTRSDRP